MEVNTAFGTRDIQGDPRDISPLLPKSPNWDSYRSNLTRFGFKKSYNLGFWLVFGGIMILFTLSKIDCISTGNITDCVAPGEGFWYQQDFYRFGLKLHLAAILPCGFLSVFQFLPIIRHRKMIIHRVNGYLVLILLSIGIAGALMITRHAFGGGFESQAALVAIATLTSISSALAYLNIKVLQVDQHRKWMLRAMFYMGTILSTRVIQVLSSVLITAKGQHYTVWRCDELQFLMDDRDFLKSYPQCLVLPPDGVVPVLAKWASIEKLGSSLRLTFGGAIWLALMVHAIGVEIYICLTPAESERLRNVAYRRQIEAGFDKPGSAGLTSDRLGDAEQWIPKDASTRRRYRTIDPASSTVQ